MPLYSFVGLSRAAPKKLGPDWLNALNDAHRQSPEIKEFSRRLHDSGGEHVTWVI
jgi:hypothetical protein